MRWCACLLAGCAGPGPGDHEPCAPGPEPTLVIGIGMGGEYEPLAAGAEFPLIHGPQGGFHLEIGLRATHLDASDLVAGHVEGEVDGEVLASTDPWLDFRCDADEDGVTSWGTLLVYDATPDRLDGEVTTVRASVTDGAGTRVDAVRAFVIRDSL